MVLELIDRDCKHASMDIPELRKIGKIEVWVLDGDEVAYVRLKDMRRGVEIYDSNVDTREVRVVNAIYILYDSKRGINRLNDERWKNRKSGQDYVKEMGGEWS